MTNPPGGCTPARFAPPDAADPGETVEAGDVSPAFAVPGVDGLRGAPGDGAAPSDGDAPSAADTAANPSTPVGAGPAHVVNVPGPDGVVPGARKPGERGRPPGRLSRIRGELPFEWRIGLGILGLVGLFVLWVVAASATSGPGTTGVRVPYPSDTWTALRELQSEGLLWSDFTASAERILYGYSISVAIGVVVGLAIGVLPGFDGTLEAPIGFLRYIPATALTPLLLSWLGIGETPKLTLIVVGTVFYNILMVADVARSVPRELIAASSTLGAGRLRTLTRVVVPHSVPGIIDVARINLAAGWLMLVVAELLATDEGLAVRVQRASRFRDYDRIFALLIVFGIIGIVSDLVLRGLRWAVAAWDR